MLGAKARYNQLRQQIMTLTECSKRTAQMARRCSMPTGLDCAGRWPVVLVNPDVDRLGVDHYPSILAEPLVLSLVRNRVGNLPQPCSPSLGDDAPQSRPIQGPELGRIVAIPRKPAGFLTDTNGARPEFRRASS
jgi:hypothetical protein